MSSQYLDSENKQVIPKTQGYIGSPKTQHIDSKIGVVEMSVSQRGDTQVGDTSVKM